MIDLNFSKDIYDTIIESDSLVFKELRRFGYNPKNYVEAQFWESPEIIIRGSSYHYHYRGILVCILRFTSGGN